MVDAMEILEDFPLLVPSRDFKEWIGIIDFEGEEISVKISVPNFPNLENFSFMGPAEWEIKLYDKLKMYYSPSTEKYNLIQLLRYLKHNEVSTSFDVSVQDECVASLQLCARVVGELRRVGPEAVVSCSADLSRVTLRLVDERGVEHQVTVGLPADYPTSPASIVNANLPDVSLSQLSQANTIVGIMSSFQNQIESLQDFWSVYEEIKNNTWIIDPENPRLKDTYCRIVIGENISMLVTFNPQDVNSCPDIKFLGPDNLVTPFINSVERCLKTVGWDEDAGVCDNLLKLLGLSQFPQRSMEAEVDTVQGECSICFTVRSHDEAPLPVKVCNNTRCDSYFHLSCLAQWFQSVPTNEASFNLISGGCPSCGEKILCPITVI